MKAAGESKYFYSQEKRTSMTLSDRIRSWRSQTWWLMTSAFLCYTGMYAVRKSFLAGQYLETDIMGLHFKTVLVISQVLGYMLSKFIGIKVIAELTPTARSRMLIGLVSLGLLMLLAFAFVPPSWKPVALFFNGLPLGMVFGVVLSYLEGRRKTELLVAALSATFIFSTGLVKSIGVWLLQDFQVSEFFMPFTTGALFFPLFLLAVWMLRVSIGPDPRDVAMRTRREPMNRAQRHAFLRQYGLGFAGLVVLYIFLTILRDFRDNFIVEFWAELGYAEEPALITLTEIPVAIVVLVISALGILITDNGRAFRTGMILTGIGGLGVLIATFFFSQQAMSPVWWMILTGISIYLPYILYHCLIFERLMAFLQFSGTIGFLFYVADAFGYAGSVGVMLLKELGNFQSTWVQFFIGLNAYAGIGIMVLAVLSLLAVRYERKRSQRMQQAPSL